MTPMCMPGDEASRKTTTIPSMVKERNCWRHRKFGEVKNLERKLSSHGAHVRVYRHGENGTKRRKRLMDVLVNEIQGEEPSRRFGKDAADAVK